jgi:hypothetical protein
LWILIVILALGLVVAAVMIAINMSTLTPPIESPRPTNTAAPTDPATTASPTPTPSPTATPSPTEGPTEVSAFDLKVGYCFIIDDIPDTFQYVTILPCSTPHDSEVIYLFDMPDGTYDEDAIDAAADEKCLAAMDSYVGPNWRNVTSEGLWYSSFTPSSGTWSQGDREIVCIAMTNSGDNELTSSVQGMG